MTADAPWTIDLSPEVEQVILDSLKPRSTTVKLVAHLRHALDLLAANGPRANGAKKLNDLDMYQIRVDDHRLFFGIVPGLRTLAVTTLVPKTKGTVRNKTYETYEKRVQAHVARLTPKSAAKPTRRR